MSTTDDEAASFMVSAASGSTSEVGGTAVFGVRLMSQPTAAVVIPLSSSDTGEGTVSPDNLSFSATNWNAEQLVTVTGVDDNLSDGNQGYRIILGADNSTSDTTGYNGLNPQDVMVMNVDDESAGFTMTINSYTSEAGAISTIKIKLNSEPTDNVSLSVASSDTTEGKITSISSGGTTSVAFTTENWNSYKSIVITGQDDNLSDGNQSYKIELGADTTTTDLRYNSKDPADVELVNLDDDTAGFYISAISNSTSELLDTATFTISLRSEPTDNVTITVASSDTTEGVANRTTIEFDNASWNTLKTVTVTGVDDNISDGNQSYAIWLGPDNTTSDTQYRYLNPDDVVVVNIDDETAGYSISAIDEYSSESGDNASFRVRLNSEPTDNVTLTLASLDTGEGTVTDPSSKQLTFQSTDWLTYQTVTVTGVDDNQTDGNQEFTIRLLGDNSTDDNRYRDLLPPTVTLTNIDDETAGFMVSTITGNTSENGSTATFTVCLLYTSPSPRDQRGSGMPWSA